MYPDYTQTPAQQAAATLPDNPRAPKDSADRFGVGLGLLTFLIVPLGTGYVALTLPSGMGWIWLLAGLPTWLILRWLMFRTRGFETGMIIVDAAGAVRVITGHSAVRRMGRLFETGITTWFRQTCLIGVAIGLLLTIGPATAAILLDQPEIMVLFMTTGSFAMLDLVRFCIKRFRYLGQQGTRILDPNVMLPLLAIYARQRGQNAVAAPIPADSLIETVMANPLDRDIAQTYAEMTEWMVAAAGYGDYR